MNIAFDRFRHPQKQGFQGGDLSDDHWSPDEAARWALRRAREERARKRVRWIAAAIVFTAFILAATVLLAQDNAELTRQAAEQGDAEAQYNLGRMYANGEGVPQDDAEAARWYRLAADQGDASAQYALAGMYAYGRGVPQDEAEAVRWYRLAADQGDAGAQFFLAGMYALGQGVPKDSVLAHMWFNIAGANGNASAREYRDILERDMTRDEISRAIELARTCMTSDYKDCKP